MTDQEKAEALWAVLVMLKRELDECPGDAGKLELPKAAWDEAVRRAELVRPSEQV